MGLKTYLFLITIATSLSWLGLIIIVGFVNPETTGLLGVSLLYITLFFSLLGTFSLFGFGFRFLTKKDQLAYKQVNIASRQAIMLSLLVVFSMMMQSQRLLYWWALLLIIIIFTFIEILLISKNRKTNHF